MGKLGKKARKFAKKNLQSVLKRKRKLNSMFKKKSSSKGKHDVVEDQEDDAVTDRRNTENDATEDVSLDAIFSEEESDVLGDDSDSDGYLSEDLSFNNAIGNGSENRVEDKIGASDLFVQNKGIRSELEKKIKKLNGLKEKDPIFSAFSESHGKNVKAINTEEIYSDEEGASDDNLQSNQQETSFYEGKLLSSSAIDSLCKLVKEQHSLPPLASLINGYRAACHYGVKATSSLDAVMCRRIQDGETFSSILMFMLHEADNVFRVLLGISSSSCRKETVLELKNTSKWKTLKPLIRSYLRSTIFLLNQVSESNILAFSLARIRRSIIFFVAFPTLQGRLMKIAVHLWATGRGKLSSLSFQILRDMASVLGSNCFDTCLMKMYKSFIGHCQVMELDLYKHIQFLRDSFVELCSQDVHRSSGKAMASIQQLAKILQQGLRTKRKEAVKKICSWQYTNCVDLWVKYIASNFHDYDLHSSLYMVIQIANGMALLFPGPRYLPLRIKCIQWLNHMSSSTGIFIPVISMVLDILEFKVSKEGGKPGKVVNVLSTVQLPKHWLKSRNFQEECVLSAIELLSAHFLQWSYHISFPELATIPLIQLKKFHETTTVDSFKRLVKRFVDQVELNINFIQKRRDEVSFSPTDQESIESFLQLEKRGACAPFSQYYKSTVEKAASRNLAVKKKNSGAMQATEKKVQQLHNGQLDSGANSNGNSQERKSKSFC